MAKAAPRKKNPIRDPDFHYFSFGGKEWHCGKGDRRSPRSIALGAAFAKAVNRTDEAAQNTDSDEEFEAALAHLDKVTRRLFLYCLMDENGKPPSEEEMLSMAEKGVQTDMLIAMRGPEDEADPTVPAPAST